MAIPFVMIELDKPRKLRFSLKAMIEYEELTGNQLLGNDNDRSMKTLAQKMWVMLRQEDDSLTFDQVIHLIDENSDKVSYFINKVSEATTKAISGEKDPNGQKPNARKDS